jgi:two-component system, LytTR family, sensor kinase
VTTAASAVLRTRAGRVVSMALAWTSVGLLFALPGISTGNNWQRSLLVALAQWWSWGLVAPGIVAIDRRLPFSEKQLGRRISAHLLLSLPITTVSVYLFGTVLALLGLEAWRVVFNVQTILGALRSMFLWSWLVYWLIVGAWQAYSYYQRYLSSEIRTERLERLFSETRLNALRTQLDPHFLFNALNTISSHVERDPRLARAMIEHLGDLLRLSLESKDRQIVPLAEEMAFLDHYLAIQKIRFGDNVQFDMRIASDVKYAPVPSLFIQPLVENAIRHGISRRASGGLVAVSARRVDGRLEIRVIDDGVGLPPGWRLETSAGLGLSVTRDRIAGLYPDGTSRFTVNRGVGGGTEVAIVLPLPLAGEEVDGAVRA